MRPAATSTSTATSQASAPRQHSKALELLLVSSLSADPFSTIVVDPRTGVAVWSYKGAELQGAVTGCVEPLGEAGEGLLIAIEGRPLLHTITVHPRRKYHVRSVLPGKVNALVTSRDGNLLFVAFENKIAAWLTATGEMQRVFEANYQKVKHLALSDDGGYLFTAGDDGNVRVYIVSEVITLDAGPTVPAFREWRAHSVEVCGMAITHGASPRVLTIGADRVATLHSIASDSCLLKVSSDRNLTACAIDAAETRIFIGNDLGVVAQVDLFALPAERELLVSTTSKDAATTGFVALLDAGHGDELRVMSVNLDATLLATGDAAGHYVIWDIASRQCLKVSTMRSAVTTLRFVAPWPSVTEPEREDDEKTHVRFAELQRQPVAEPRLVCLNPADEEECRDFWLSKIDDMIEKCLALPEYSGTVTQTKQQLQKMNESTTSNGSATGGDEDAALMDVGRGDEKEGGEEDGEATSERVRELEREVARLQKANDEIFEYASKIIMTNRLMTNE